MNTSHHHGAALAPLACLLTALALGACKDDSPCDDGQVARGVNCYPAGTAGGAGQAGAAGEAGSSGDADAGDSGAATTPASFAIGQPCTDTDNSSDCGGEAPICAPIPSGPACTQILCQDGEPNAGVCPSDWPCMVFGANPSLCFKF